MNWNLAVPAAVVGAATATIGLILLELYFKPAFARKRVATILLAEVRLAARGLTAVRDHIAKHPESVPEDVWASVLGWEAVRAEIHYLPGPVLDSLLLRYAQFREISALVERYSRKVDRVYGSPLEAIQKRALLEELKYDAGLFSESIPKILVGCELTIDKLLRVLSDPYAE